VRGVKTTLREGERPVGKKKTVRFHITIEKVVDKGEEQPTEELPTTHTYESLTLSPVLPTKRSQGRCE
jgi:hypothetical protein